MKVVIMGLVLFLFSVGFVIPSFAHTTVEEGGDLNHQ